MEHPEHDTEDHHEDEDHNHDEIKTDLPLALEISLYAPVAAIVIITNCLTIGAVATRRKLRTIPNMYITSLAVADLLVGVLVVIQLFGKLPAWSAEMDRNKWWCVLTSAFLFMLVALSTLCMLIIAVDRFVYIVFPLKYAVLLTPHRALIIILISWTVAVLYGLVPVCSHHYIPEDGCQPTHVFPEAYMIGAHPTLFFTICCISALLYVVIMRVVSRQKRIIRVQECVGGQDQDRQRHHRRMNGAVKMMLLVFGLFFLCWCPMLVVMVMEYTVHIPHLYLNICSVLVILHSAFNFFIYAGSNAPFRHAFRAMLCPWTAKSRVHPEAFTTDSQPAATQVSSVKF